MILSLMEDDLLHCLIALLSFPLIIIGAWLSSYVPEQRTESIIISEGEEELPIEPSGVSRSFSVEDEGHRDSTNDQTIEIILKFIDETQRSIVVHGNDTIHKLKRFDRE